MVHYRNRQRETSVAMASPISTNTELDRKHLLDTNIVCMFTKENADCPNLIKRVKTTIERNLKGKSYSKYANFPSCSESDWATRYWRNYTQLLDIKSTWDPSNTFNHCQSVGSTDNSCCPDYSGGLCDKATDGQACIFPFRYMGRRHATCTRAGWPNPWCATSLSSWGGVRTWGWCDKAC